MDNIQESREYKALKQLEDSLNSTSWSPKKFAECIKYMHPYLQSTLFRTIKASLDHFADPAKYVDGRNEHCKTIAQQVINNTKNIW